MPHSPRTRAIQTEVINYRSLPQSLREDETLYASLADRIADKPDATVSDCSFRLVEVLLPELDRYIVHDLTSYLDDKDFEAGEADLDRTWMFIKALQQGKAVLPVVIAPANDDEVELLDGYHRVTAHYHAGRMAILAYELVLPSDN